MTKSVYLARICTRLFALHLVAMDKLLNSHLRELKGKPFSLDPSEVPSPSPTYGLCPCHERSYILYFFPFYGTISISI